MSTSNYVHPEALVNTDWMVQHLNDPKVRIIESNEDVSLRRILDPVGLYGACSGRERVATRPVSLSGLSDLRIPAIGGQNAY